LKNYVVDGTTRRRHANGFVEALYFIASGPWGAIQRSQPLPNPRFRCGIHVHSYYRKQQAQQWSHASETNRKPSIDRKQLDEWTKADRKANQNDLSDNK
jgi:hypothetical protein